MGKAGFNFGLLATLIIVMIVSMIADGLSKLSNLTRGISIVMAIVYMLPIAIYVILLLGPGTSTLDWWVLPLFLFPWGINSILSIISIFTNKKPVAIATDE